MEISRGVFHQQLSTSTQAISEGEVAEVYQQLQPGMLDDLKLEHIIAQGTPIATGEDDPSAASVTTGAKGKPDKLQTVASFKTKPEPTIAASSATGDGRTGYQPSIGCPRESPIRC